VFTCFVWISEQIAIISLYSINWLVFITEAECLLRGTDWIFNIQQFYVLPIQCVYVFCISEQTGIISLYSINWLVFITETKCVYCAVRTESLTFNNPTFCPHSVFMRFVWISEQRAIISLYSNNWLVFITETCVYCAVRTESLTFNNHTFCPHSVFMRFVWTSEQTAIISLYSINWLVFITETKCVYCAIRTESLTFNNSTFCPYSVFMCFVWISEQTAIISLYSINWLVFVTETKCLLRGTDWMCKIFQFNLEAFKC
jgi:hypothetical protein